MAGRAMKVMRPPVKSNRRRIMGRDEQGNFISALTPELTDVIVRQVATGVSLETAAAAAGVTLPTLRKWLIRGRDALMADEIPESEMIFAQLIHRVEGILARYEIDTLERINKHGEQDWTALAWILERRHPEKYGRRSRVDIANADDTPFRIHAEGLDSVPPAELRELREHLVKIRGALGAGEEIVEGEFKELPTETAAA